MGINEKIVDAFKSVPINKVLTRQEIIKIVQSHYDIAESSILPSDMCYNSSNKGIEGNGKTRIFLKEGRGIYRYVGPYYSENYNQYQYGTIHQSIKNDEPIFKDNDTGPYVKQSESYYFGMITVKIISGIIYFFRVLIDVSFDRDTPKTKHRSYTSRTYKKGRRKTYRRRRNVIKSGASLFGDFISYRPSPKMGARKNRGKW